MLRRGSSKTVVPKQQRRRLGVRIVWARDTIESLPDCYVKISVGNVKMKSQVAEGGHELVFFDHAGSLEVSDSSLEMVCELFKVGKIIGRKNIGQTHLIGQVCIPKEPYKRALIHSKETY